jgi:hypothetical protein
MPDGESDDDKKEFGSMDHLDALSTGPTFSFETQAPRRLGCTTIEDKAAIALK